MSVIAPEINLPKRNTYVYPNYRLDQIPQQTGGDTVTMLPAGGNNSLFELPAVVFNLSKCVLSFNMNITAQGADNINALDISFHTSDTSNFTTQTVS